VAKAVADFGQALDEGGHLTGAQSAVQADTEWLTVSNAGVKCLCCLAAQCAAGHVDDSAGDDKKGTLGADGLEVLVDGKERGFGIQGVENSFNK
jgi:hypothetical protein